MSEEVQDQLDMDAVLLDNIERRKALMKVMEGEKVGLDTMANTPQLLTAYAKLLNDNDKAVIGRARIKTDEKAADNDREIAASVINFIADLQGSNPMATPNPTHREPPKKPEGIEDEFNIDPGVLENNPELEDVNAFRRRMESGES